MSDRANNLDEPSKAGKPETIGGLLAAALDMEDQISGGVYEDYMNRRNWPVELPVEVFVQIRARLTTLIEDTKKHTQILRALVDEYGQRTQSG